MRKIGVELEYSNLSIDKCAKLVTSHFDGKIEKRSKVEYLIKETEVGDFKIELDTAILKKFFEDNMFKKISKDLDDFIDNIEDIAASIAEWMVPYEIVFPPIEIDKIDVIDSFISTLRKHGALGTSSSFRYAFGLHLNIEPKDFSAKALASHIRAYLLLQDWLLHQNEVDLSRQMSPFIDSFESDYIELMLDENYFPNMNELIDDYIKYNPTRNRSLDMLPLFAHIDEKRVRNKLPKEKIHKRPTFHYRMPNSKVDLHRWRVADELMIWRFVERVAESKETFELLAKMYQKHQNSLFSTKEEWIRGINIWLSDL